MDRRSAYGTATEGRQQEADAEATSVRGCYYSLRMSKQELESLKEWLKSWGDDNVPNWCDASRQLVPIAKVTLKKLIEEAEKAHSE